MSTTVNTTEVHEEQNSIEVTLYGKQKQKFVIKRYFGPDEDARRNAIRLIGITANELSESFEFTQP